MVAALERQGVLRIESAQGSGNPMIRDNNVMAVQSEADYRGPGASLFWDRIRPSDAPYLLMHEVGEHYGLIRMLGQRLYLDLLSEVRDAHRRGTDPAIDEAWSFVRTNYVENPKVGQGMVEGDARFMREVVARVVETAPTRPFVRRLLDAIRAWLYDTFGVGEIDSHLLRGLATAALRQAAQGKLTRTPQRFESPSNFALDGVDSREGARISPRNPTGVKRAEDPLAGQLQPDVATMARDPALLAHNVSLLQASPDMPKLRGSPAQKAEQAIEHFKNNLLWLYNHMEPALRARAKQWYAGGNRIAHRFAREYGVSPEQVAGVIAALSPQKHWFENVRLAQGILQAVTQHSTERLTPDRLRALEGREWWQKLSAVDRAKVAGKTLREAYSADDLLSMAHWIRAWDEATLPQQSPVITPEGDFDGVFSTKEGQPSKLRAQGFAPMVKALKILIDGSQPNISRVIGNDHKVRSFYNNIIAPMSKSGDVTIDTHAVAAAHLLPLGAESSQVSQAFGGGVIGGPQSRSSVITGLSGNYAIYADAYRRAAAEVGLLPREMQSITWEAVRHLFRPEQKKGPFNASIANIWREARNGRITEEQARDQISKLAGGIARPDWAGSDRGGAQGQAFAVDARKLPGAGVPGRGSEERAGGNRGVAAEGSGVTGAEFAVGQQGQRPPVPSRTGIFGRGAGGYQEFLPGRAVWEKIAKRTNDLLRHVGLNNDNLSPDMRAALRDYYARIARANIAAKDVASAASEFTPEERTLISDYIERELAAGVTPPARVVRVAEGIQRAIAQQTAELVEAGMISESSAERWQGRYLPRFYEGKVFRSSDPSIQGRKLDAELIRSLRIMGSHLKGRGLFERVTVAEFERDYRPLGWELRATPRGAPIDTLADDDMVVAWRDFTKEERERMGEIRDGLFRFVRGYVETQKDIAMGRLLQRMARDPAISSDVNPDGTWLKVPDTEIEGTGGLKHYGELSGRFVSREVYDQIVHMREIKHPAWAFYLKALALWKEGKTVWNPVSHGNNLFSNFIGAHMAGVDLWNARAYRDAWRELRRKEGPIYNEALANGLLSMDFVSIELGEILPSDGEFDDVQQAQRSMLGKVFDYAMRYTGTALYREKMTELYRFEDQLFRFLIYREARLRGESEVEAANYAEQYVFNYSDLPRTARIIRDSPVGLPFFSWSYKAVPMVSRTFAVAPHRLLPIYILLFGTGFLSYAIMGGEADEEDERAKLPDYMKGLSALGTPKSIRMPFNDVNGNPVFFDISKRVPLGDFFDAQNQMGGVPLIQTFTPNNPVITTAVAMLANKDAFTGRDLVPKYESGPEAAKIRMQWLASTMLPSAPQIPLSWSFDKAMNGIASATDTEIDLGFKAYSGVTSRGDKVDPLLIAADITGIAKLRAPNLEAEEMGRDIRMRGTVREIDAAIRRVMNSKVLTQEAKDRERRRLMDRREAIQREREKEQTQ
jgi:hypothetical protein